MTTSVNDSASDLLERWLAHRQQELGDVDAGGTPDAAHDTEPVHEPTPVPPVEPVAEADLVAQPDLIAEPNLIAEPAAEPVPEPNLITEPVAEADRVVASSPAEAVEVAEDPEVVETVEEFEEFAHPVPASSPAEAVEAVEVVEEFAHPVPALGGAPDAPSSSSRETPGEAPEPASAPAPVRTGASVPRQAQPPTKPPTPVRRPDLAPTPGLVLFSPRRGIRHLLTATAALLAAAVGITGYVAWQSLTPNSFGVAGAMLAALFLVWKLRSGTSGTQITIENGMLRITQGNSHHLFPLAGARPAIDIVGEPGQRSWKVLIERRGMSPFVITRRMVEPSEFTEVIRHFRPEA